MRFAINFVFGLFLILVDFVHLFEEVPAEFYRQYDFGSKETGFETAASFCAQAVAPPSQRFPCSLSTTIAENPSNFAAPSFQGSTFFAPHHQRNDRHDAMEVFELQAAWKALSDVLLQSALAERNRQIVHPSVQTGSGTDRPLCTRLETRSTMGAKMALEFTSTANAVSQTSQGQEAEWQHATRPITWPWTWASFCAQQPGKGKGKGKGDFPQVPQAPLPPPPMPWPGYMPMGQNMPVMMPQMAQIQPMQIAPASTKTTMQSMQHPPMPAPTMTPEQQAREQKMQELMAYLKRRGPDPAQDVSQKVHDFSKKDGAQAKKDLQTAAKALGEAKDTLEAALQARTNLISSWNTFLTDAVRTWQEYGHLFQSQETEHQERIQAAREVFTLAKQQVDEAKSAVGEAIEVNDVDDEEDLAAPSNAATSEKITESMQFLTASLHQFQHSKEQKKYMWKFSHHSNAPD